MIKLRPLRPSTVGQLARHLTRTPDAPAWLAEVEDYILEWGPAAVFRTKAGQVLLVDDDGTVIGAAVHLPHDRFPATQRLSAVLLDHRYRGQGRGADVLRAAVLAAHSESGQPHVMWMVHQDNQHMQHLSSKVGEYVVTDGDYQVFVHDQ